jgi:hypothetical protein
MPHDHGDDDFDDLFHHRHHHNLYNLSPTYLDSDLDAATATDGLGHALFGSGNPASGWEVQTNGSFQVGSNVHYRTGDTAQPVGVTDDGTLIYQMPAGPQVEDQQHGVSAGRPDRAATSFDFSFDTGVGSGQTIEHFLASGGEFIFKIDLDPTQHNKPLTLHAVYDESLNTGGSHVVWEDSHNHVVIADDSGNQFTTQNSQNYAFYQSLIHVDPHTHDQAQIGPAGLFDIEEQIIAPHDHVVADVHSLLDIGTVPLPTEHHEPPPTMLNATLDVGATDGHGHTLNGSGNPAAGWETQTSGSFQLGSDIHYRQGDTAQPVAVDDHGVLIYHMPKGAQVADPSHGVSNPNSTHAATNFDFSFDTGVGSGQHQTIQDFLASGGQFIFKIDLDPTEHNNPLTLHAVYEGNNPDGSGVVWEDSHNHIFIADDGGNAYVTQNSENYAFYKSLIDVDPDTHGVQTGPVGPAGTFDIEEQIIAPNHHVVADIHSSLLLA